MHSMSIIGGSEGGSDLIDAAHIKTEMKIEPTQIVGGKLWQCDLKLSICCKTLY